MNFLQIHFRPQPRSRVTSAYTVRPGDVVLFEDGSDLTVECADFGDPHQLGFASFEGRMAAPWVFRFADGRTKTTHPKMPVRIRDDN